jgi:hypothetical protein
MVVYIHDETFYTNAIEKLFHIVNNDRESVPFLLNKPQKRMMQELSGSNRDIILKARKEGISSMVLAMFAVDFLTVENIRCVIISHEDKATQRLFDRVRYFLESMKKTWPGELPYKLKYNTKTELVNTVKNSTFYIGTAGARAFGRGDDIHNLHISELAFYPDQENIMLGLTNAVTSSGRIIVETTANGLGDYFYKMFVKAREGNSPYRFHFIPWFELEEYVMPVLSIFEPLIEEEQRLMNQYQLSKEQIAWRRWKINEMGGDWHDPASWDKFNQEFPATAEEAFIVSGNPVWSPTLLKYYLTHTQKPKLVGNLRGYMPITIEPNEKGSLKIWKEPNDLHTYAIGVDVSEGKVVSESGGGRERDASCAQVFDKTTYEQVACWYGRIDPDLLGRQLDMLGRYYNDALIGVERNAIGITPLIVLRDLNYPNIYYREKLGMMTEKITSELGWVTDHQSKESIISDATNLLRDKRIQLYDEHTIGEMMSFVRNVDGKAAAARSAYDDRVMAFLIALRMLSRAKVTNRGNDIERSDADMLQEQKGFFMEGNSFNNKGWPTPPDQMDGGLDMDSF